MNLEQKTKLVNGGTGYVIFLLLFCFVLPNRTEAQKSYFSLEVNSNIGWRIFASNNAEVYENKRNEKEIPLLDINGAVKYNRFLTSNIIISAGLACSRFGYQYHERFIDPGHSPLTTGFKYQRQRYNFTYLGIPLDLSFRVKNRFFISAGVGVNLPVKISRKWIVMKHPVRFVSDNININESVNELKKTMVSTNVELRYRLKERFLCIDEISLYSSMMFTTLENDHIEDVEYNIGLLVNENKALEERLVNFGISMKHFFFRK